MVVTGIIIHCEQVNCRDARGALTEESEHENAVISYPQLVGIFKVVPGHEVVLLHQQQETLSRENCTHTHTVLIFQK